MRCDPGLTPTRESAVDAVARIDVDGRSVTELNRDLASTPAVQRALVAAIRESLAGLGRATARETLREAGVDAVGGLYRDLALDVATGDERAVWDLLRLTRQLGGRTSVDVPSSIDDLQRAHTRLFALADRTPTIVVRVREGFREQRADQRREVCAWIAALATGCDVRLVAGPIIGAWLARAHPADLPANLSDRFDQRQASSAVADATDAFDPESREVRVLEALAREEGATMAYDTLRSQQTVSAARVSQVVGRLEEFDLVAKYGPRGSQRVELRPAGRQFLDALNDEIGRQQRLDMELSDRGQSVHDHRVTQASTGGGDRAAAAAVGTANRSATAYLPRWRHAAAAASAPDGGIGVVERPPIRGGDGRDAAVSYSSTADQLVVAAEFHSPLQYVVSLARGLTDGRVRSTALPEDRVDELVTDADRSLLRGARQLGWLPEDVTDGADYWGELVSAREELLDLTHALRHCDEDDDTAADEATLRRETMQLAHGLAGTVAHTLDRLGVDLVREVRIPNYRKFGPDRRAAVVETLAHMTTVQSRYGEFAGHRQLFEDRKEKRETTLSPRVDAADPTGTMIGRTTIVVPKAGDLADRLETRLGEADPHEDAPEFAVAVSIDREHGRRAIRQAVGGVGDHLRLRPTRSAVAVVQALVPTPYEAAEAINHLGRTDHRRDLRLDEVRYALAHLPEDRLLPDAFPTVRAVLGALLTADEPLSRSALADRADVSERSLRRHAETLVALDLVRETDDGLRLTLPFDATEDVAPRPVEDRLTTAPDLVQRVARTVCDEEPAVTAPDPGERLRRYAAIPALESWVSVAGALAAATIDADPPPRDPDTVTVGPDPGQASIQAVRGVTG